MEQNKVNKEFDLIIANTCRSGICDKAVLEHTFDEYMSHKNHMMTQEQARLLFLQQK